MAHTISPGSLCPQQQTRPSRPWVKALQVLKGKLQKLEDSHKQIHIFAIRAEFLRDE